MNTEPQNTETTEDTEKVIQYSREREQYYKNTVSSWRNSTLAFLKAQGFT